MKMRQPNLSDALLVTALTCWLSPGFVDGWPWQGEPGIVRGIYTGGEAVDTRTWRVYGKGYDLDRREKHSGGASLRARMFPQQKRTERFRVSASIRKRPGLLWLPAGPSSKA